MTRHEFKAETRELLDLMINSLYSHKEIFLRELISNASDALDRRRFESLTDEKLRSEAEARIRLSTDKAARTLTISDNGIGMSRDEVVTYLGTIAHSGTKAIKQRLAEAKKAGEEVTAELIGQFGVGFYSSFMVADAVEVLTRRAGEEVATRWTSQADGTYEIEDASRDEAGTDIVLRLKPVDDEAGLEDFTDEYALRRVVKKYSDFVNYPIMMEVTRTEKGEDDTSTVVTKDEQLNSQKAIWTRPESEVSDEEYEQFYRHIGHDWAPPAARVGFSVEGTFEAKGLLFVPSQPPPDLYHPEMKRGIQLYVRRVFIMDEAKELAPSWLRFVKGVVDAEDLDLNVSREILQQSRQVRAIRRQVVKKVLDELSRLAKEDFDAYRKVWANFGPVLKEGLVQGEDKERTRLLNVLLAPSSKEEHTTLAGYVERMPEGQDTIYYHVANDVEAAKRSPHLEAFAKKGYEVLFFTDNIDELWLERNPDFDGKKLASVAHADVDLDASATDEEKKEKQEKHEEREKALEGLLGTLRKHLQDDVKEVRLSKRLETSAVVLVSESGDMSPQLERIMSQLGQNVPKAKRILELNPEHAVVGKLASLHETNPEAPELEDHAQLLYGQAILAEGGQLADPAAFADRVAKLMAR